MGQARSLQTSFTSGVLDPQVESRTDLEHFFRGMRTGDNVVVLPQGGVRRRPGLKYVAALPGASRVAAFNYSEDVAYALVFSDEQIDVYYNDTFQATIVTPWLEAELDDVKYAQAGEVMIICHPDHAPRRLFRGASHTSWSLDTPSFDYIPQVDFDDASSPTPTSEVQDLTFTGFSDGEEFVLEISYADGTSKTASIEYSADTSTMENRLAFEIYQVWVVGGKRTDITVAHTGGTTYRVTFANGAAKPYDVITGYVSVGTGSVGSSRIATGVARTEDAWSATRGWPRSVCFYQGRMVFGGTKSLPQSVFGSRSNLFFDFFLGEGNDDDGIFVTLDTNTLNYIQNVVPGRHLQVFTTGGEFYAPASVWSPEDSVLRATTQHGASRVTPVEVDGATLFIERKGKVVRSFTYTEVEQAYVAENISVLSSSLISGPVDASMLKGTDTDDANFAYLVNDDGTVAVLNTLRSQGVTAWTRWTTNVPGGDAFKSVAVVNTEVFFVTLRGGTYYLERADKEYYTDSAVQGTNSPAAATGTLGTSHLDGETVAARVDGQSHVDLVPAAGVATFSTDVEDWEVGYPIVVRVETMPAVINMEQGASLTRKSRIIECNLDVYQTLGLIVNGYEIPDRVADVSALDTAPAPFDGIRVVKTRGWSRKPTIIITQTGALPMTIRGIDLLVESNTHG